RLDRDHPAAAHLVPLSLHDALPILAVRFGGEEFALLVPRCPLKQARACAEELRGAVEDLQPADIPITISIGLACSQNQPDISLRSEEHTSELQSRENLVCRLLLEKQ